MDKKEIKEELPYDIFNGSIYDITQGEVSQIIVAYKKVESDALALGYSRVEFDIVSSWGDTDYRAYGYRMETEEEFEKRKSRSDKAKAAAKKRKEKLKEKRRQQYEALKKEFE